jgi:AmiR/NasT family two-component response regulator
VHAERAVATLWQAIETRQVIGQATGVWMERYDRAFALIVKLSQKWNAKLNVIAEQIVSSRKDSDAADQPARAIPKPGPTPLPKQQGTR